MEENRMIDIAHRNLLGVFGERDPQVRATVIEEIYTEDVRFADPDGVVTGREALGKKAQHLLDEAAGFVFTTAGPARVTQNLVLLPWHFGPAGQPPVASGVDVSIVEDGRIAQLYTLLDPPAA